MPSIKVLHATLEYIKRVGGVGVVTTGLTPALIKQGFDVSVVTPFYDIYAEHYKGQELKKVATLTHIYKGNTFSSDVYRACVDVINGSPLHHYLIKPVANSPVARIFDIGMDETKLYQAFPWSEPHNRREYFNSALAAMLRMPEDNIPQFDIYHAHTWHTGLAGVLAKEFENLPKWRNLYKAAKKPLKKISYFLLTFHMLLDREHGQITSEAAVNNLLASVGLPADFAQKFSSWQQHISPHHLKQVVLPALYADAVTMVSEGLAFEAAHIKGGGQGLDDLFSWLNQNGRLFGILNGLDRKRFNACDPSVLGKFAFTTSDIADHKLRIKQYLAAKYPNLDPNKMWFGFIGRFAAEKGIDMLPHALEAITKEDGILIIMGTHVVSVMKDGKTISRYKEEIDALKKHPNVVVIDDPMEQKLVGMLFRGAMDCVLMPSHNEACGMPQMEGFALGAYAVASRRQGLPDSVKDLERDPNNGTGFLYEDDAQTGPQNLQQAIQNAAEFYRHQHANGTMNKFLQHLLEYSKQLDWNERPARNYAALYHKVTKRALLTFERVRTTFKPMLHLFKHITQHREQRASATKVIPATPSVAEGTLAVKPRSGKIFQIGFNKCGTQMLYYAFLENNVSSAHYAAKGRTLAATIADNNRNNRPLLHGIDHFNAYFDMEDIYHTPPLYTAFDLFKKLDQQYPGSRFILNTRDKRAWIQSRLAHKDPANNRRYADVLCQQYQCSEQDLIQRWSKEWDDHHKAVREYFRHRACDLLEYNLDTDAPEKICAFFKDLNLNPEVFKVINKTADHESPNTQLVVPRPVLTL